MKTNPHFWDLMTDEERSRHFRYFTREQLEQAMAESGLPEYCEDDATLRRMAEIQVRAERAAAAAEARPGAA